MRRTAVESFKSLLGRDLWNLATRHAGELRSVTQLTSLPSTLLDRASFLLEFSNGRLVKGRRVDSNAYAEKIESFLSVLGHANMPTLLDRHGRALLMEWIPGRPLRNEHNDPAFVTRVGALQGELHDWPIPDPLFSAYAPRADVWREELDHQINQLLECDALTFIQAKQAQNLAFERLPANNKFALCHGDLHPENIVIREKDEQVFVIDNETVGIHSPFYDILRTWHRWPLHGALWKAYLEGYKSTNNLADFSQQFSFWAIFVLVQSALFRIQGRIPSADQTLAKLKRLLEDPTVEMD